MKYVKIIYIQAVLSLFVIFSCNEEEGNQHQSLVEATQFLTRSASEIKTFMQASGLDLPLDAIQYDVVIYHVTYRTQFKGSEILASGVVILPETSSSVGMVSFQHGTITAHSQAPSMLPLNSSELIYYSSLSTIGMITAVPDFIGFGTSSNVMHPYYVEEYTASSVMDLLVAAKELAHEKGVSFNEKLFLAGYSQGGYATMATHKAIEENGLSGFDLIASFPAAGGYDIKGVQEYFFNQVTYDDPYYLAYVARSYQTAYEWTAPLSDFFKAPYASLIPGLFDGTKTGGQINAQLTTTVADLVTDDLLANIDTDIQYAYIVNAFNENSLVDWTPTLPMFMYHGDSDVTVPYQNSVEVYNQFIDNGASTSTLEFITLSGANHGSGVAPYIEDFIPKLIDQK